MRQVFPTVDVESTVSQRLIEAALEGDGAKVWRALSNILVDVNYLGTVNLKTKYGVSVQHEEAPDELKIYYEQFKTDVTPLFAAAHAGQVHIVRRLLTAGADVNQKLFRGYATTAAAREGHHEVLSILLRAGASQPACEEALLEACLFGQFQAAELLINSEMTRPKISVSALVHASSRGFVDIVAMLIKSGVDVDSWHRILLRSEKPSLYSSVNCTPLIAAIVARQTSVVKYLLDAGARTDCKARIGAWSWELGSDEVLRVGAGMAEPYNEAWCAVEYWENKGTILRLLLEHISPDSEHHGRTLIYHAILCRNVAAAEVILEAGADIEYCVHTKYGQEFRPLHFAAIIGFLPTLQTLISHGCDLNAKIESGETALMLCAMHGNWECFRELLSAGADVGIENKTGQCVINIAESRNDRSFVDQAIEDAILAGQKLHTSDIQIFSPLHFVTRSGNAEVLQKLLQQKDINLNAQDKLGFSALMIAAQQGHIEAFKVLIFSEADIGLKNTKGESALELAQGQESLERVLYDAILAGLLKGGDFKPLHFAAKRGNLDILVHLLSQRCPIDMLDEEGYTPLMISAIEGHADACKLLLREGADCYIVNSRGETALALAGRNRSAKVAEGIIFDYIAKKFVLAGEQLFKHIRRGKGAPHTKLLRMLKSGVLTWGKSRRRNVYCKEARLGPSPTFWSNRRKGDAGKAGTFRIVTTTGREIHFEAAAAANAELWVRGISLISKEAMGPAAAASGLRQSTCTL